MISRVCRNSNVHSRNFDCCYLTILCKRSSLNHVAPHWKQTWTFQPLPPKNPLMYLLFSVDNGYKTPFPLRTFVKFLEPLPLFWCIRFMNDPLFSLYNHIDANFKRRFLKCLFPFKLNRLFREMSSIGYRVLIELFEIVSDSPFLLWLCRILNSPLI